MKVFNVRFGLATNSSSSHSLIFLKDGDKAFDYGGYDSTEDGITLSEVSGDFGWQRFTVATPKLKLRYLAVLLRDRLNAVLPGPIANLICEGWLDQTPLESENGDDDFIDHQSWMVIPFQFNTSVPDREFFDDLKQFFLNERLVILGGNDNHDAPHVLDDGSTFTLPLPRDERHNSPYTCRKDAEYGYWTIFCPEDGRKIRFAFADDPAKIHETPTKAFAPELVDIKITDYCPYRCEFCYQGSTPTGKHAHNYHVSHLSDMLARLKVFEVAIGGGEPTLHPDFEKILKNFRKNGIVPNFTTKNLNWLRDPRKWPKWIDLCGGFAYSAEKSADIDELGAALAYNGISPDKAHVHIVMGTVNEYGFLNMLEAASRNLLSVTLLGYKTTGFGLDYAHITYGWWLDVIDTVRVENEKFVKISVDTVLAKQFEEEIVAREVPSWLFTVEDGKFSAYIDAVSMTMGPSSYCPADQMKPLLEPGSDHYSLIPHGKITDIFKEF